MLSKNIFTAALLLLGSCATFAQNSSRPLVARNPSPESISPAQLARDNDRKEAEQFQAKAELFQLAQQNSNNWQNLKTSIESDMQREIEQTRLQLAQAKEEKEQTAYAARLRRQEELRALAKTQPETAALGFAETLQGEL